MKGTIAILILIALAIVFFKCDDSTRVERQKTQGQDSELALLMRQMHVDAKEIKEEIINDNSLSDYNLNNDFLLDATPTKSNVKGVKFESMARYYLQKSDSLYHNPTKGSYNQMVESCIVCHQAFCPGPVKTIKKLKIN